MKKSKLKSIIKEYIIEANKDTMQYDLMNRELKSALKVKDFEKAAFYKELLMSSNLQASVGWDRFKGSWAYESWIKKPNTQSMIKQLKDESQRFAYLREDNSDEMYAEYVGERQGEEPFMMRDKKWQYVNAKYSNGKVDIGVYSFSEDMVYTYDTFRKMYNIKEASVSENSNSETQKKSGYVMVGEVEYTYTATVSISNSTAREPHGEDLTTEYLDDVDITSIQPEPTPDMEKLVLREIYKDIRRSFAQ